MILELLIGTVVVVWLLLLFVMLGLAAWSACADRRPHRERVERDAQRDLYPTTSRNVIALPKRRGFDDRS